MKNVLVTGGAGYIGSHTCKLLSQLGFTPIVLDNLSNGHKEFVKWGEFYQGNQDDDKIIEEIFKNHHIEDVIHFSAFAYVGESIKDPIKYYENNTIGTIKLIKKLDQLGVRNFVFSSTCAIYGTPEKLPISENLPKNPINPYGHSKLLIEEMMDWITTVSKINFVALRYFNAAGASMDLDIGERHDPETHLIPLTLMSARFGNEINVFGNDYQTPDGTCIRDYIHVLDLADAHIKALNYLQNGGESTKINLGTGHGTSVMEIINQVEKTTGQKCQVKIGPRRPGDPAILVADNSKALELLGWKPKYSQIDNIIETAWNWLVQEEEKIKKVA